MVIDTSALIAILEQEDDAQQFADAIAAASTRLISAATVLETGIVVVARHDDEAGGDLDQLLRDALVEIVPVTEDHARLARDAFIRFGKGRHPARLNFGDCFSYALAKASGQPLLFKGNDFSQTDVHIVNLTGPPAEAPST
jgi:ribonuclease VapC